MSVIIYVLITLLFALLIFIIGPAMLEVPLLVIDLCDLIMFAIKRQADNWKKAIKSLREAFGRD
jgi:hypothetical protein